LQNSPRLQRNRNEVIPIKPENDLPLVDCHNHFPDKEPYRKPTHSDEEQYDFFFNQHKGQFIISSASDWDYDYIQNYIQAHENKYMTMGYNIPSERYNRSFEDLKVFVDFLKNNKDKYVAIGEFGLDFHHGKSIKMRETQVEVFQKIIKETKSLNKPYALHVRNPTQRNIDQNFPNHEYNQRDICNRIVLEKLVEEQIPPERVMWHCFSGPAEWGPKLAEKGYYISIPSSAYGFKRWRRNIPGVPIENLLTETDACLQHPFRMGAYNTPANVKYSIAAIAYVNEIDQLEVAKKVLENARRFFGVK